MDSAKRDVINQCCSARTGKRLAHFIVPACVIILLLSCDNRAQQAIRAKTGWEKIGPGGGGATFIPTFSGSTADKFLIRCDMSGAYITDDGGRSFTQINFQNGVSSFAFDPNDSNKVYAGSSVLNVSADGGKTWSMLFPKKDEIIKEVYSGDHASYQIESTKESLYEPAAGNVSNIRVDPALPGSLYLSMGRFFFYSADKGNTWKKEDCKNTIEFIYTDRQESRNKVFIFTGTSQYIFDKNGKTLTEQKLPASMSPAFSFTAGITGQDKREVFYALHHDQQQAIENEFGHSEVWMSADGGKTWKPDTASVITNSVVGINPSYSMITCSEQNAEQAYLVTNRYEEKKDSGYIYWYGAMKTNDAGKSWQWVWKGGGGSGRYGVKDGKGVENLADAWAEKAFGGEYIRLMDVGVSPSDGNIAIVTDWYRTMKTMDGGKSWLQVYSRPQSDETFSSNGMDVTTTYGVHFDPFDSDHIAISYTDIGYHHSYNRGKSWSRSVEGVPAEWVNTCYWVAFDPAVKNKLWSAWSGMHDIPRGKMTRNPKWKETARGGVCVSVDGGKTWKPSYDGMGFDSPVTCMVVDPRSPAGNRTLYASVYSKGVFKSTDDGKTWTLKNKGIDSNTCAFELTLTPGGNLFLVVSPTPAHVNGKKGRAYYPGAVYSSMDGAETWKKLHIADNLIFPNGIEYDPANPGRIFLACWSDIDLSDLIGGDIARNTGGNERLKTPGGIFLSEDNGNSWKQVLDEHQYAYDVTADPFHPGRFYANTFNRAAWRSEDDGNTWKRISGYDFHWGHRVIVDRNDPEKIYLTTYGSSVWHGVPVVD
jgi:photosystem II stability/assembly factor-like uncharacterized protein